MYAYFDGDRIGSTIELLLMDNQLDEACNVSCKLNKALDELKNLITERLKADVIIYGGDDLLVKFDKSTNNAIEIINIVTKLYFDICKIGESKKCSIFLLNLYSAGKLNTSILKKMSKPLGFDTIDLHLGLFF